MNRLQKMWQVERLLMGLACALHLIQLPLYPVDRKWVAALVGTLLYAMATVLIHRNKQLGYWLATVGPLVAAAFVGGILLGLIPRPPDMTFNPFTAMAALVEAPAVLLGLLLIRARCWEQPLT